jgi:hypothetical protein
MLIDASSTGVVAGSKFDLELDDVEEWLSDECSASVCVVTR